MLVYKVCFKNYGRSNFNRRDRFRKQIRKFIYRIAYTANGLHELTGTYAHFYWNFSWLVCINVRQVSSVLSRTYWYKPYNPYSLKRKSVQLWSLKSEMTLSGNESCSNWNVSLACGNVLLKSYAIHIHILQFWR